MSATTLVAPETRNERSNKKSTQSALWQRYHQESAGGPAEEELIRNHLPLVKTVVGRLAMTLPSHVDEDDLHSAGLVGLLNATRNYDPNSGASFESYARVRIRGSIIDELRRMDWVPRSVHAKSRKVKAAMQTVEQRTGRTPTEEEMMDELDLSAKEYWKLLDEIRPATFISIDSAGRNADEGETSLGETIADERAEDPNEAAGRGELVALVNERLEQLPEMQRKVLALYYFEDLRLREIAEIFGLTESRICQIHSQAILAIKSYLRRKDIDEA